jgi:uncharacterized protein (TIGR04222 family)
MSTWGISGPQFLLLYATLAALVLVGTLVRRRRWTAGPSTANARELTPTEVALLAGGRQLALYSSLAALRAADAVRGERGYLTQRGPVPFQAAELDRAVYSAAAGGARQRDLAGVAGVRDVLDRTESALVGEGWLLGPAAQRSVRGASLGMFAVFAFGVVRAFAGASNGRPIGYLVLLMAAVFVTALLLLRVPRRSGAATRLLGRLRADAAHLRPSQSPSWSTYGPGAAALGVGLFGAQALWLADPAFAEAAEIQRRTASSAYGGGASCGSGDGGGGGGGGGCGGGGCGGGGCGG